MIFLPERSAAVERSRSVGRNHEFGCIRTCRRPTQLDRSGRDVQTAAHGIRIPAYSTGRYSRRGVEVTMHCPMDHGRARLHTNPIVERRHEGIDVGCSY